MAKTKKKKTKRPSRKDAEKKIGEFGPWTVKRGRLVPSRGRPPKVEGLFCVVAEKIPFECLDAVQEDAKAEELPKEGIYLAHDSMGHARYVRRGQIFKRLTDHRKAHPKELHYFSFYVIANKKHEREVETLVIRAASPLLEFNDRKKRKTVETGNIRDYEPNTVFYERQRKKGRKKA